jgi:hypothetical protein
MYSSQSKADNKQSSSLKRKLLRLAHETGLIRAGRGLWAQSLTVVNYHRIDDPSRKDFDSFKPNVSATPEDFNQQMDYLAKWFNVISVRDLVQWLDGEKELPPFAALITFDDRAHWYRCSLLLGYGSLLLLSYKRESTHVSRWES